MNIVTDTAGAGRAARSGRDIRILLHGEATGGMLAIVNCQVPAGTAGPPLHAHPASEETFIVLEGQLLLHLDGRVVRLGAGSLAHVQRGARHTFATPPSSGARFLTVHTPGGFERFHEAAARAERDAGHSLGPPELAVLARTYDWAPAGPPLLPDGRLADVATGP